MFMEQLANLVQIETRVLSESIGISASMLSRRAKEGRFTQTESDRLISFLTVYEHANSLFENDAAAAEKWLSFPALGLGSKRPIDMLSPRVETEAVLDFIGRLERGMVV